MSYFTHEGETRGSRQPHGVTEPRSGENEIYQVRVPKFKIDIRLQKIVIFRSGLRKELEI